MGDPLAISCAVIGMGHPLPRSLGSRDQRWEALLRGDDLVTEIPAAAWDAADYYDAEPGVPGHSVSTWVAFLDDVAGFDREFCSLGKHRSGVCRGVDY